MMSWKRCILISLVTVASGVSAAGQARGAAWRIPVQEAVVLSAGWGSGPDELGVATPSEANPEGPMSFALGADGTVFVLDQRNRRIQVFAAGKRKRSFPLERETWVDLDVSPDKGFALLDNSPPGEIRLLAPSGESRFSTALEGRLLPSAAEGFEVQLVPEGPWAGVWVVVNARSGPNRAVRLAGSDGSPLPRVSVPGRVAADGETIFDIWSEGDRTLGVTVYEKGSLSRFQHVRISTGLIHAVRGIWRERGGNLYAIAAVDAGQKTAREEVIVLGVDLRERGRFSIPVQKLPHEIFRPFRVDATGSVFQMIVEPDGRVRVRRFIPLSGAGIP